MVMIEEWKIKGTLLQELETMRIRIAELEQVINEKIEEKSKELKQPFMQFFDNADEGVLIIDIKNQQIVAGNKMMCQILSCDPEEVVNLTLEDIFPQEDFDYVIGQLQKRARGALALTTNIAIKRRDNSVILTDINSFPVKSFGKTYLMSIFREILPGKSQSEIQHVNYGDSYSGKPLTASELKIFELIANGMSNKDIASLLHRSTRTIEWHRSHIMHKLGVDNSADLMKRAALMGIVDLTKKSRQEEHT
jgi:PAS domain S-box-containing protein